MRHLLDTAALSGDDIVGLLELTDSFVEVSARSIPKVPALRGKTVVSLFYEDSTRTRLSFETAAKRLSADTMTFSVGTSSVKKGESVRDTVETIEAMGIDAVVVRHSSADAQSISSPHVRSPYSPVETPDGFRKTASGCATAQSQATAAARPARSAYAISNGR